jgi:hypothetical protein
MVTANQTDLGCHTVTDLKDRAAEAATPAAHNPDLTEVNMFHEYAIERQKRSIPQEPPCCNMPDLKAARKNLRLCVDINRAIECYAPVNLWRRTGMGPWQIIEIHRAQFLAGKKSLVWKAA